MKILLSLTNISYIFTEMSLSLYLALKLFKNNKVMKTIKFPKR